MFAYVTKFITIRCNLAIEVTMIWDIHQMDVKSTFLNGVLEVKIYMNQLERFAQEENKHLVCKFKKLYMDSSEIAKGVLLPY
jgi:hypothetical protein